MPRLQRYFPEEEIATFFESQWRKNVPNVKIQKDINVEELLRLLTSKKWRSSAMDQESRVDLWNKLEESKKSRVLEFSLPFGGYKSHHIPGYPYPNWAEIFAISYLRRYLENALQIWDGRIVLSFSYCSSVMDLVNNTKLSDQSKYIEAFSNALMWFSDEWIKFRLHDVADSYGGPTGVREALTANFKHVQRTWHEVPRLTVAKRLQSASRNLHIASVPAGQLLHLNDDRVVTSAMMCEALDSLSKRREFNKFSKRIQLVNVRGPNLSIHIRSCETSANHFGVGIGVASKEKGRWRQRILSRRQWETVMQKASHRKVSTEISKDFKWLKATLVCDSI